MDKDYNITKGENVLIHKPADVTDHFRDPQMFNYEGQLYAIVGAQNLENQALSNFTKRMTITWKHGRKLATLILAALVQNT